MSKNAVPTRLDRLEKLAEELIQQNKLTDKRFAATDKRWAELMEKMVNQNILLGQRIDSNNQQMNQRMDAVNQRMDTTIQQMNQQNTALGQRIDATLQRIDAQQQHANYLYEQITQNNLQIQKNDLQIQQLLPMLEKLPDAVRDQIGFSKSSKANGEKNKKH